MKEVVAMVDAEDMANIAAYVASVAAFTFAAPKTGQGGATPNAAAHQGSFAQVKEATTTEWAQKCNRCHAPEGRARIRAFRSWPDNSRPIC
jgi:cytochrome c553